MREPPACSHKEAMFDRNIRIARELLLFLILWPCERCISGWGPLARGVLCVPHNVTRFSRAKHLPPIPRSAHLYELDASRRDTDMKAASSAHVLRHTQKANFEVVSD